MPVSASTSLTAPDTGRDDDRSPPAPPSPKKPTSEGCSFTRDDAGRAALGLPRPTSRAVEARAAPPLAGGDGGWSRDASSWPTRGGDDGRAALVVFSSFVFAASSSKTGRRSLGVALRASIVASSCVAYGVVGMFVACGTATIGAEVGSSASSASASGGMALLVGPVRGGASGSIAPPRLDRPLAGFGSTPPTRCHATSTPGFDERCISLGDVSAS
mmetsp:Transcript_7889/g.32492  ORF Transcript_7889/g.32492 Transcript_7889/m.32492 type:complete len:216 (-) Transcript_7889:678-1325(-)